MNSPQSTADQIHFEGNTIRGLRYVKWSTKQVLPVDDDCVRDGVLPNATLEKSDKGPKVKHWMDVLLLIVFLYACLVIPLVAVFYDISQSWSMQLALANIISVQCIFLIDSLVQLREKTKWGRVKLLASPSFIGPCIPWAGLSYLLDGPVVTTGFLMGTVLFRVPVVFTRYRASAMIILNKFWSHPAPQLIRLLWLFALILIIQNVFGSFYYYLGISGSTESWVYYDKIDAENNTRVVKDSFSAPMLRYIRSVYFVYQTLLTVGYGDVAPWDGGPRLFAAGLCLLGTFILALLIANMTSYLVNMDSTPQKHRTNTEIVELVMDLKKTSYETRIATRKRLERLWKTSKGILRNRILDDLPETLVDKIANDHADCFKRIPLFFDPSNKLYLPVVLHIVKHSEIYIFEEKEKVVWETGLLVVMKGALKRDDHASDGINDRRKTSVVPWSFVGSSLGSTLSESVSSQIVPPSSSSTRRRGSGSLNTSMRVRKMDRKPNETPEDLFPTVVGTGGTVGSALLLNLYEDFPPVYVAVRRASILLFSRDQFKKLAIKFPGWGMQRFVESHERSMKGGDVQSSLREEHRMGSQLCSEIPEVGKRFRGSSSSSISSDSKLRSMKFRPLPNNMNLERKPRFQLTFPVGGKVDTALICLVLIVALYQSLIIPLRISLALTGDSFSQSALIFAFVDLFADIVICFHKYGKNQIIKRVVEKEDNTGEKLVKDISHNTCLVGKRDDSPFDETILAKVIALENAKLKQERWEKRKKLLNSFMEASLLLLSVSSYLILYVFPDSKNTRILVAKLRGLYIFRVSMLPELAQKIISMIHGYLHNDEDGPSRIDEQESNSSSLSVNLSISFVLTAHLIACFGMTIVTHLSNQLRQKYLLGLYWALTTMTTVGFGDIAPVSGEASLFGSFFAVLGVAVYSVMVSLVSSFLKDSEASEHNPSHHRACLDAYLLDREVSPDLQTKVQNYLDYVEKHDITAVKRVLQGAATKRCTTEKAGSAVRIVGSLDSEFLPGSARALVVYDLLAGSLQDCGLCKELEGDFMLELCSLMQMEIITSGGSVLSVESKLHFLSKGNVQEFGTNSIKVRVLDAGNIFGFINFTGTDDIPEKRWEARNTCELWYMTRQTLLQCFALFPEEKKQFEQNYLEYLATNQKTSESLEKNLKNDKLAKMAGIGMESSRETKRYVVFSLDSKVQKYWNSVVFLSLIWVFLAFPLRAAFSYELALSSFSYTIDSIISAVYIADVYLRMYHFEYRNQDGEELSEPHMFRAEYIRSSLGKWDILSAIPLSLLYFAMNVGPRTYYALRAIKLLRGFRIVAHIRAFGTEFKNPFQRSVITITKLIFTLLLVAHWSGCFYYVIALNSVASGDKSWASSDKTKLLVPANSAVLPWEEIGYVSPIVSMGDGKWGLVKMLNGTLTAETPIGDVWFQHYIVSLYFAVTTVTAVGYGDIFPESSLEILYTIFILVIGGLLYSVIIAFLEDIVAQADLTSALFQQKTDMMNNFLKMKEVPPLMKSQFKAYLLKQWGSQKGVEETKVLSFLDRDIRGQVVCEVAGGQDVFEKCPVIGPSGLWRFIIPDVEVFTLQPRETVFEIGEEAKYLYLVLEGTVDCVSPDRSTIYYTVQTGQTLGQDGFFRPEGRGYQATAWCVGQVRVARLSQEIVSEFLELNPGPLVEAYNSHYQKFIEKPSLIEYTRKNFEQNQKLAKMLQDQSKNKVEVTGMDRFIIFPNTLPYLCWHVAMFMVTIYNCTVIPYCLAKTCPEGAIGLDIFADSLLLVHILFSVTIISRVENGMLLKSGQSIRRSFCKLRGLCDVLAVLPIDWIIFGATRERFIVRTIRLYWVLYLQDYWKIYETAIDSSGKISIKSGYRHLIKIVLLVLLTSHCLACGYITIANASYTDSIYWSFFTMTTVGYGNTDIDTLGKRVFAMFVMIIGAFLCDAGITSTLCSIIHIEDSNHAESNRFWEAAKQLAELESLSPVSQERITEYYEFKRQRQSEVDIFKQMNPGFAVNVKGYLLLRAMGRPTERCAQFQNFSPGMIRSLVNGVRPKLFVSGDIIFDAGNPVDKIVFVLSGTLKVFVGAPSIWGNHSAKEGKGKLDRQKSYKSVTKKQNNVIQALENNDSRAMLLENPGLLLPNRAWGETTKELILCKSVCEAWVCDQELYKRIKKMQPSIGGQFHNLEELISDQLGLKEFENFLNETPEKVFLQFLVDLRKFERSPEVVYKKYLAAGAPSQLDFPQGFSINPQAKLEDSVQEVKVFVTSTLNASLSKFENDSSFKEFALRAQQLRRQQVALAMHK